MNHQAWVGLGIWTVIFYPLWSPRCRRIRRRKRIDLSVQNTSKARQRGPAWEQDEPFPECFEEDDL